MHKKRDDAPFNMIQWYEFKDEKKQQQLIFKALEVQLQLT